MPDVMPVLETTLHHPQLAASYAIWLMLLLGIVKFTPPARSAAMPCSCGGDMETCTCGTPKAPLPRPYTGGAR